MYWLFIALPVAAADSSEDSATLREPTGPSVEAPRSHPKAGCATVSGAVYSGVAGALLGLVVAGVRRRR